MEPAGVSASARVLSRCRRTDRGCLEYQGSISRNGYGRATTATGTWGYTHRIVYEAKRGPIPPGAVLDHLCRNRRCCNPDHLEPVTQQVNTVRGIRSITRRRLRREAGDDPQAG